MHSLLNKKSKPVFKNEKKKWKQQQSQDNACSPNLVCYIDQLSNHFVFVQK